MSVGIALDNILLRPAPRWAHTEYSLNYHRAYLERKTGLNSQDPRFMRRVNEVFGIDFNWLTHDGPIDWAAAGRVTDMGHAIYAADGSDLSASRPCPFGSEEEVWAFDAVAEYGLPDEEELVRLYEGLVQDARRCLPEQLTTGGYYRTLVSGAIAAFGWEMLLAACANPAKMEKVWDSFFRRTLYHMRAWARTSAAVIIQHDDFVWTSGPFMHPDLYRQVLIPRYAELWKPLHAAGQRVLFCSDGHYLEFMGDLAAAGADGFIFEPCNDFGAVAEQFGQTHCLVGSYVDCRDLTLGKWEKAQADIDRTLTALQKCRGAIWAVGNHLPPNIPEAMLDRYFDYLLPRLGR